MHTWIATPFPFFDWSKLDQNRRLPPLLMGGEKANSRICVIAAGAAC
jgi:hypothetical protein